MTTIAELRQAITDNSARIEQVRVIVEDLRNGTTIPPAVQAEIDGAAVDIGNQAAALDEVINGGAPPPQPFTRGVTRMPPTRR